MHGSTKTWPCKTRGRRVRVREARDSRARAGRRFEWQTRHQVRVQVSAAPASCADAIRARHRTRTARESPASETGWWRCGGKPSAWAPIGGVRIWTSCAESSVRILGCASARCCRNISIASLCESWLYFASWSALLLLPPRVPPGESSRPPAPPLLCPVPVPHSQLSPRIHAESLILAAAVVVA